MKKRTLLSTQDWVFESLCRQILNHFKSLSGVLCSDECQTKKAFQYVTRVLPFFRAVEYGTLHLANFLGGKEILRKQCDLFAILHKSRYQFPWHSLHAAINKCFITAAPVMNFME